MLDLLTRIGRIDGTTAWTVWGLNVGFAGGLLPAETVSRVWTGDKDPLIAGRITFGQPAGVPFV